MGFFTRGKKKDVPAAALSAPSPAEGGGNGGFGDLHQLLQNRGLHSIEYSQIFRVNYWDDPMIDYGGQKDTGMMYNSFHNHPIRYGGCREYGPPPVRYLSATPLAPPPRSAHYGPPPQLPYYAPPPPSQFHYSPQPPRHHYAPAPPPAYDHFYDYDR